MSRYFIVVFNVRHRHRGVHTPAVTDELSDEMSRNVFLSTRQPERSLATCCETVDF
jgi:hypothetical protein